MYEYPKELYCGRCKEIVSPALRDCRAEYTHPIKGDFTIRYKAAFCPVCGELLCERDQDIAFMEYLKGEEEHGKENNSDK